MSRKTIDQLIINSPYEEPKHYWGYDRETRLFGLKDGRRPAGYIIASESSKAFDDPGVFVEIPLVNREQRLRARLGPPISMLRWVPGWWLRSEGESALSEKERRVRRLSAFRIPGTRLWVG